MFFGLSFYFFIKTMVKVFIFVNLLILFVFFSWFVGGDFKNREDLGRELSAGRET